MKAKEIRDLTAEELEQTYGERKREMFNLRVQKSIGQLEQPLRIRSLRRDLARMQTIMSERATRSAQ